MTVEQRFWRWWRKADQLEREIRRVQRELDTVAEVPKILRGSR